MDNVRQLPPREASDDPMRDRPRDQAAEQIVLGTILEHPDALNGAASVLAASDFVDLRHAHLWQHLVRLHLRGVPISTEALGSELVRAGEIASIGGANYLHDVWTMAHVLGSLDYWVQKVREKSRLRRIDDAAIRLRQLAHTPDPNPDIDEIFGVVRRELDEVAEDIAVPQQRDGRMVSGASFILDIPRTAPAVWGHDKEILWAEGESLVIAGPGGVGKTTLAQQVVLASVGVLPDVLGMPVRQCTKALYLASDRPPQAARSFARMVTEDHRELLDERLAIWKGPPPSDFVKDPQTLLKLCRAAGADLVCIDSLKDMTAELAKEEGGQGINKAIQLALVEGIQVVSLHHHRKAGGGEQGGKEPLTTADLYGSVWIPNGSGSVISLWGAAGDPIVHMRHLKQPMEEIGPLRLRHDHNAGRTEVWHQVDILDMLRAAGTEGLSPVTLAVNLYPNPDAKPTANEVEKARRKLDEYVKKGLAKSAKQGTAKTAKTLYYPMFDEQGVMFE
ncbi:DnaB-like helicase N-terminal domain-containing protein [Embleya sp. NPDC050154]|uniref:DnaB-like helicase N-terminal domain-containing protein n=1 Tax=Embleya sp. NPDC050154 TaxID=3363988 RepID=UPI00379E1077